LPIKKGIRDKITNTLIRLAKNMFKKEGIYDKSGVEVIGF
jgi:hypothetical protein